MRQLVVHKNDADQRLDKFLQKTLPNLPKSLMYKYIRNKKIKVDGKRCTPEQKLMEGNILSCYIAEEFFAVEQDISFLQALHPLDVVYEDDNLIIMNKPIGLLCHENNQEKIDTLVNRMKKYLFLKQSYDYLKEQSFTPALAHRLDRNTQGLVIGAKNAESLRNINLIIKERQLQKFYFAIVEGTLPKKADTWVHYHQKVDQKVSISAVQQDGYKEIKTSYRVLAEKKGYSFIEVELFSGKSHQIRAQFAFMGHPLLGDTRYKAKKSDFAYQALCAYKLVFHTADNVYFSYLNNRSIEINNSYVETYFSKL